jgi:hypothetical protein
VSNSLSRSSQTDIDFGDPNLLLSASELGAFTYCPESWVLDRAGAPQTAQGERRLRDGSFAHRQIGARVDQLTIVERASQIAAISILLLLVFVLLQAMGMVQLP